MRILLPERSTSKIEWARCYAQLGWAVLPLHYPKEGRCSCGKSCSSPAKHPLLANGVNAASTDIADIDHWWQQWPEANIGVATGDKSGVVVVDVDKRDDGLKALDRLIEENGAFETSVVATGGGGLHCYFQYPGKKQIRNRVNVVKGIDVRSTGGYVVAPPSVHASGQGYAWRSNQTLSEAPYWLIALIDSSGKSVEASAKSQAILEGSRNDLLAGIAGTLRKRGLQEAVIRQELEGFNARLCAPPLPKEEVATISRSISRYQPETIWKPVREIKEEIASAPNMDETFLPSILKPWALDIATRMQVPIEFIAAPAIVALSSVIGRKIAVHPKQKDDWLVVPNLWGGIIARPGFFKSPTMAEALAPLEAIASEENNAYARALESWEMDKSIIDATVEATKDQLIKAIKRGDDVNTSSLQTKMKELREEAEHSRPKARRFKTNDATIEKLACLLKDNPNGLLVVRDELYGWLASLGKQGREGDREFYLESWNGFGSFTIDRVGRGTTHLSSLCLSVFGGIQPSKLEKYLTSIDEGMDDGLLQRFQLLIYPELSKHWKNYDIAPNLGAKYRVEKLFRSIVEMRSNETCKLRFDDSAQEIFNDWRSKLETKLRSGEVANCSYESHLAKYRKLMPALALVFYVVENIDHLDGDDQIGTQYAELSIKWCHYLDLHAQKIYRVGKDPRFKSASALADKIKAGKVRDGESLRSIYRRHWSYLDSPEKLEGATAILAEHGWIQVQTTKGAFKSSSTIRINPNL